MPNPRQLKDLLLQMGFTSADFNGVRMARDRNEALQKLEVLKVRFKTALRKRIPSLHPDRTGGDSVKAHQLQILLDFARELEKTQIPPEVAAPRVVIHEVTFQYTVDKGMATVYYGRTDGPIRGDHNPIPQTRRRAGWAGLPDEIRTYVTSSSVASTLAGMCPFGVYHGR